MRKLAIRGGHVITPVEERLTDVIIEGGAVSALGKVTSGDDLEIIEASGCWVTPGLIDLQVNGGPQCDFWADPTPEQVKKFADSLVKAGVTTILPTLITDDLDHLRKNLDFLATTMQVSEEQLSPGWVGAQPVTSGKAATQLSTAPKSSKQAAAQQKTLPVRMPGVHLEGPCLSPQRPGVHPPQHLQPLSLEVLRKITTSGVKLITLAPELNPNADIVQFLLDKKVCIALGHSNATYEEAQKAFADGITMMTHTFNAMAPLHHRNPGAVTAALLEDKIWCCLIADGQHLVPPAVQLILRTKGIAKTILVTDIAHVGTSQGGLVGSSILLNEAVENVVRWGFCTFPEAIRMASYNPAKALGWEQKVGVIAPGAAADLVVWDKETLAIKRVISRGQLR